MAKQFGKAQLKFVSRKSEDYSTGPYRNDFMRDRDRILYSKPYRRLSRKTQIFLPSFDDHVRTRLTHSLEVAQISTISAQALGLDRDLTEAIALGHDIGHTPFGHTGERVLHLISINCDMLGGLSPQLSYEKMGFKHNLQGVRVTSDLDLLYQNVSGLNLSNFTLWGIQNHSNKSWKKCGFRKKENDGSYICNNPQNRKRSICIHGNNHDALKNMFYNQYDDLLKIRSSSHNGHYAWSFEGFLIEKADEIAQRHHDIEDGLIAKAIVISDILDLISELIRPYFTKEESKIFNSLHKEDLELIIPKMSKLIVGCLNRSLIENSLINFNHFFKNFDIKSQKDFNKLYPILNMDDLFFNGHKDIPIKNIISYPPDLEIDERILKENLKKNILNSYQVQRMDGKAKFIIRQLAKAYLSNPQQLRDSTIKQFFRTSYPDKESCGQLSIGEKRHWLNEMYYSSGDVGLKNELLRLICDYISSMTDDFASEEYARLYYNSENNFFM